MSRKVNLINGNFITLDDQCPFAETISVENGRIAGINAIDQNRENIDLQGATVIPGFTDSHFHLSNLGKQLDSLNLRNYRSSKDVAERVVKRSRELAKGDWIFGFGWDHNKWADQEFPTADLLNDLVISKTKNYSRKPL